MGEGSITDGMLEVFLYENETMLEQMEALVLEKTDGRFSEADVNEIFRIMHTIKGSSAIMMYQNITEVAHKLEDIFYYIRESHPEGIPQKELTDHVLRAGDFIKGELGKIRNGNDCDGNPQPYLDAMERFIEQLKAGISMKGKELPPERELKEPPHYYITPEKITNSRFYMIQIFFGQDVDMANIKAYTMVYSLKEVAEDLVYEPEDIITNPESGRKILEDGFQMAVQTLAESDEVMRLIDHVGGVTNIDIRECSEKEFRAFAGKAADEEESAGALPAGSSTEEKKSGEAERAEASAGQATEPADKPESMRTDENIKPAKADSYRTEAVSTPPVTDTGGVDAQVPDETAHPAGMGDVPTGIKKSGKGSLKSSYISVNVGKMDQLMDLIGELVIAEAVVLQNPDLKVPGLNLTNFQKAAGQLMKITSELQDVIMVMRMMPLSTTFKKMKRIVHDLEEKLDKDVELVILGESTEVDKNIIEHISDPLMHLIRNAMDHGVETRDERKLTNKPQKARVVLEAKNENGKVWISVSDDGKGLSRESIIKKAEQNGLLQDRQEKELSDSEVFNFITLPGFSTNKTVTEYSGRGVGMDVVVQNLKDIGGSLEIDSTEGYGTKMIMKIPLTLAIIDGIIFGVGEATYVVATGDVKEFVRVRQDQIVVEPEGEESVMIRGEFYQVLRLKQFYGLKSGIDNVEEGIMVILEHEGKQLALFIDKLIGEQEIVVKPMPPYIKRIRGLSGCTQLGDGSISLILDTSSLLKE